MDDDRACPYLHIIFECDIAKDCSPSAYHHSIADRGMPLSALVSRAAQGYALL